METNYISGEYFKYLLLAIFLLAGRTFVYLYAALLSEKDASTLLSQ